MTRSIRALSVGVVALVAGAAQAQTTLASFSYDSLSGAYVAGSPTNGVFTANAVDLPVLRTVGDFNRTVASEGNADFPAGFVTDANLADISISLPVAVTGATTASIGLSPEEQSVLAGEASPSGLPGTRSYFRGVEGIARGLQTPTPLPAAPASRWTSMAGGVMRLVTSVGRVLAVAGMITALVAKIWGIMKFMSSSAQAQRQGFAKVDPVFAAMEAQYRISSLMSDIAVARDPTVRQSMQNFTNAQMARSQGQVPLRRAWARISAYGGAQYEGMMSALEMTVGGLLGGDMRIWSLGAVSQFGYLAQLAIPGLGIGVNQYIQSYVQSQLTAGVKNANQLFMGDIASMTAGRFSESQAYMGKNANARNWWTARP
jgi:hypothetical protein